MLLFSDYFILFYFYYFLFSFHFQNEWDIKYFCPSLKILSEGKKRIKLKKIMQVFPKWTHFFDPRRFLIKSWNIASLSKKWEIRLLIVNFKVIPMIFLNDRHNYLWIIIYLILTLILLICHILLDIFVLFYFLKS